MVDKTQQAMDFIATCCPSIGAFQGGPEPFIFLRDTASEMLASQSTEVFPQRHLEHIAYAVGMVSSNGFLSSPAAIAAVYLVTRFETYFRVLSGKLDREGSWLSSADQKATFCAIGDNRIVKKRISNVALAYKIMMLGNAKIVPYFSALDARLYPNTQPQMPRSGQIVADLGDRIEYMRHSAGHGSWGDLSAEANFYGLLTAAIFYAQK
jgi:hypothetical protein